MLGRPGPLKFGTYCLRLFVPCGPVGVTNPAPVVNLVAGILATCAFVGEIVGNTRVLTTVVVIELTVN